MVLDQFQEKLPENSSDLATATVQRLPGLCQGSSQARPQLQEEADHLLRVSVPT